MDRFEFFFSFHLGERLYSYTDNLSKTLQACSKMAAVGGQRLANLTKETLTKMRIDQSFDLFYANVARKSASLIGEPKKATHSGRTRGWCWCTKLFPNCQRSF